MKHFVYPLFIFPIYYPLLILNLIWSNLQLPAKENYFQEMFSCLLLKWKAMRKKHKIISLPGLKTLFTTQFSLHHDSNAYSFSCGGKFTYLKPSILPPNTVHVFMYLSHTFLSAVSFIEVWKRNKRNIVPLILNKTQIATVLTYPNIIQMQKCMQWCLTWTSWTLWWRKLKLYI